MSTRARAPKHLLIAAFAFSAVFACGPRNEGLDTTKIPDDLQSDYQLFTVRCSKCHSLARPLSAGITDDQQWVDYVNRMRRQPGSGISYEDQAHILKFLKWYAAELRHQKAEKDEPAACRCLVAGGRLRPRQLRRHLPAAQMDGGQ